MRQQVQALLREQQPRVRRSEIEIVGHRPDDPLEAAAVQKGVVDRRSIEVRPPAAQAEGGVPLGVEIDEEGPAPETRQAGAQVDGRGRLAAAPLLVGDGDHAHSGPRSASPAAERRLSISRRSARPTPRRQAEAGAAGWLRRIGMRAATEVLTRASLST